MDIQTEGGLKSKLKYGNIWRTAKHEREVLTNAKANIALSSVIVLPVTRSKGIVGLRVPLFRLALEKKFNVQWGWVDRTEDNLERGSEKSLWRPDVDQ